jgi:NAD(P)-dependent dehydrogenase (short-subunit alcohol dehydrogenase family)
MLTGTAPETTEDVYGTVMDVNVGGTFRLARYGIPALERAGGGSIVLTASELGLVGASEAVAYCASKGAVINMTRALAIDCGPLGIRVNCLCPGPIDTPGTGTPEAGGPSSFEALGILRGLRSIDFVGSTWSR